MLRLLYNPARCCVLMLAASDPSNVAKDQAARELTALGRIGHKDRRAYLHSLYSDDAVRQAAYVAYSQAASRAGGTPEFGWLGREALVAKYGEADADVLLAQARQARSEKNGADGVRKIGRRAHAAAAAKQEHGAAGLSRKAGTAAARKRGARVGYAGVRWQKKQKKKKAEAADDEESSGAGVEDGFWRTAFSHCGTRFSVGSYASEEEAARAHDAFVIHHGLERELHFPPPSADGEDADEAAQ